jgi:hypothetical protein
LAALHELNIVFAHRINIDYAQTTNLLLPSDFLSELQEDGSFVLLPADPAGTGKRGMSFMLVTSETASVLTAAHSFRGAANFGCHAYPLNKLPACFSLVADKVHLTAGGAAGSGGVPVLLHASLSPKTRMKATDFGVALQQWQACAQVCCMVGAAGEGDCLCDSSSWASSVEGEEQENQPEEEQESGHCSAAANAACSAARATVEGAAAKLSSTSGMAASVQPPGGSPGSALAGPEVTAVPETAH